MIKPSDIIASIAPYQGAIFTVPDGVTPLSLSQNESAYPPSPKAIAAGREALGEAHLYADPDWTDLRQAIAAVHDVDPGLILCGAGSMELIACLAACYGGPGRRVLASEHAYAYFRSATQATGAAYDTAPETNLTVDVDALLAGVRPDTSIVFIANPGNPTGTRIPRAEVVRLRDGLRDDILLVIDEAYGEFADAPGEKTFDLVERGDTVVLRTFSKAYALAGMRVGWGVFPTAIANELRKILRLNNITGAAQAMATAAMNDQTHIRGICDRTATIRDKFISAIGAMGLAVTESATNFALVRFADAQAAIDCDTALRTSGIITRGMAGYGLADCLRVTIGLADQMDHTAAALKDWKDAQQ